MIPSLPEPLFTKQTLFERHTPRLKMSFLTGSARVLYTTVSYGACKYPDVLNHEDYAVLRTTLGLHNEPVTSGWTMPIEDAVINAVNAPGAPRMGYLYPGWFRAYPPRYLPELERWAGELKPADWDEQMRDYIREREFPKKKPTSAGRRRRRATASRP